MVYPGLLQLAVVHLDERRSPRAGVLRPDHQRLQGRGRRSRQAQPVLRRVSRRDGHDGRILPVDRRSHLQDRARSRATNSPSTGTARRYRQDHRRRRQDRRGREGRYQRARPVPCGARPADRAARRARRPAIWNPVPGHYGIFAGKSWRNNIRPLVLDFIDANVAPTRESSARKAKPSTRTVGGAESQRRIRAVVRSGRSSVGRWPASGMISSCALRHQMGHEFVTPHRAQSVVFAA